MRGSAKHAALALLWLTVQLVSAAPLDTTAAPYVCHDPDSDGLCDELDSCPNDAENDADGDDICAMEYCRSNLVFAGIGFGDCSTYAVGERNHGFCAVDAMVCHFCACECIAKCPVADDCPYDDENDPDSDVVCGDVDSCPYDAENDPDGDGRCDEDECPFDPENDADNDVLCAGNDSCPYDRFNDEDGDDICGNVDSCPRDAENDPDADGNCLNDVCPYDAENDADGDRVCGDVDSCPYDGGNDEDSDSICANLDSCPLHDDNDPDSDNVCNDPCPGDPENDADSDEVCGEVDVCPYDPGNDDDNDAICFAEDSCPYDRENDADSDILCGAAPSICVDDRSFENSHGLNCSAFVVGEENHENCASDAAGAWMYCGCACGDNCPYDIENDIDDDFVCASVDSCPTDRNNDADGDGMCAGVDSCPFDPENDWDSDELCDLTDETCADDPFFATRCVCSSAVFGACCVVCCLALPRRAKSRFFCRVQVWEVHNVRRWATKPPLLHLRRGL